MSRIGKAPITLPKGVEVKVDEKTNTVTVKGPKGQLRPLTPTYTSKSKTDTSS